MPRNEIHVRVDATLDRQIEHESVVRRTSKNQLIIGILQRALNPNPNDEATVFRRLDRVEKAMYELEKAVRVLVQKQRDIHEETLTGLRDIQGETLVGLRTMQAAVTTAQSETKFLKLHVTTTAESMLRTQAKSHEAFLQRLMTHAVSQGKGFLRKVGESFAASIHG